MRKDGAGHTIPRSALREEQGESHFSALHNPASEGTATREAACSGLSPGVERDGGDDGGADAIPAQTTRRGVRGGTDSALLYFRMRENNDNAQASQTASGSVLSNHSPMRRYFS